MKYKLKSGIEVDLTEEDIKAIVKLHENEEFDIDEMSEYFHNLHKHAISKMEMISEMIITDEDSIDVAAEHVMKYGTYMDFAKFMRYELDFNLAYHILESVK